MNKLIVILFFLGCYNANSSIIIKDDKSYLTFICDDSDKYDVTIGDSIFFSVKGENQCNQLHEIPTGRNQIVISRRGKIVLQRDIFISNGETFRMDIR